jgi:hypothetical protein
MVRPVNMESKNSCPRRTVQAWSFRGFRNFQPYGVPNKSNYRRYWIRTVEGQDDFANMAEITGFIFNGAIYGGHNNYDSGRAGLEGLANASTEGSEWSTFIGGGYDFHLGHLTVGPIASLQYTDVGIDSFSENGLPAPLAIHSDSAESLRTDAGFRVFYPWQIGKIVVEPSLKAAWEHEYKYSALRSQPGLLNTWAIVDLLRCKRRSRQRDSERQCLRSSDACYFNVCQLRRAAWARKLRFKRRYRRNEEA